MHPPTLQQLHATHNSAAATHEPFSFQSQHTHIHTSSQRLRYSFRGILRCSSASYARFRTADSLNYCSSSAASPPLPSCCSSPASLSVSYFRTRASICVYAWHRAFLHALISCHPEFGDFKANERQLVLHRQALGFGLEGWRTKTGNGGWRAVQHCSTTARIQSLAKTVPHCVGQLVCLPYICNCRSSKVN